MQFESLKTPTVEIEEGYAVKCSSANCQLLAFFPTREQAQQFKNEHEQSHAFWQSLAEKVIQRAKEDGIDLSAPTWSQEQPQEPLNRSELGSVQLATKDSPMKTYDADVIPGLCGVIVDGIPYDLDNVQFVIPPDTVREINEIVNVRDERARKGDTSPITTMQNIAEMLATMTDQEVMEWRMNIVAKWGQGVCLGCADEFKMRGAALRGETGRIIVRPHNCGK